MDLVRPSSSSEFWPSNQDAAAAAREASGIASEAESHDSERTREPTPPDYHGIIEERRQRKVLLGGRLSRPVKEYRKEDVPLHPPRGQRSEYQLSGAYETADDWPDEVYYDEYIGLEAAYFDAELRAWEAFLWRKRREWQKRNDAAGGTIPPPPPITEHDPLELHLEYLEFIRAQLRARPPRNGTDDWASRWVFDNTFVFREHIEAVEQQEAELRRELGSGTEAPLPQQQSAADETEQPAALEAAERPKNKRKTLHKEEDNPADALSSDVHPSKSAKRSKRARAGPSQQTSASNQPPANTLGKRRGAPQSATAETSPDVAPAAAKGRGKSRAINKIKVNNRKTPESRGVGGPDADVPAQCLRRSARIRSKRAAGTAASS